MKQGFTSALLLLCACADVSPPMTSGDPPFLLIHGTADEVVPIRQSRFMRDTLRSVGVPATLTELRGVGHSVPEFSAEPRFRASICTTLQFLRERLRPGS